MLHDFLELVLVVNSQQLTVNSQQSTANNSLLTISADFAGGIQQEFGAKLVLGSTALYP